MNEPEIDINKIACYNCVNNILCFNNQPKKNEYYICDAFEFKKRS